MSDPERLAFERWLNNGHHCGANENMWKAWLARSLLDAAPTPSTPAPVAVWQETDEDGTPLWGENTFADGPAKGSFDYERALYATPPTRPDVGEAATEDQVIELAVALEQQRALHIVRAVRQEGLAQSGCVIPTQAESVFELACEEIEHRLKNEAWELVGGAFAPTPQDGEPT